MRIRARLAAAAWQLAGWSLFTAAFAAGLWLVVDQARRGHGSVGDIVLTVTIATTLHSSVQQTVRRAADSAYAGRLIEPYLWLRDYSAAARPSSRSARPPARLTSGIDLRDVSYTYPGTASPALDGITAQIPAGTVVAVVGEYGSGKTTLAKLLAKFYQPQHGTIRVDGTDLAELGTAEWRTSMASAFQDFGRYHVTAAEAVGLGDPGHLNDTRRIDAAIAQADARTLVDRMPHGLKTQLGKELGGIQLSEGQWQKIALARASMRPQPLLFILDEPTASLDAPSEHAVHELYMARARATAAATGAITLIISHRFSTVTGADHILVLNDGKLEDAGTHAELMARGGRYAEMYSIQETAYARKPVEATRDQTD
jgi:ATP-binding cassette subfamily B protein